jgi:hypothetical protein
VQWVRAAALSALVALGAGCGLASETTTVGPDPTGPTPTTLAFPTITAPAGTPPPLPVRGRPTVVVSNYVGQPAASVKALLAVQRSLVPRYVPYPVTSPSRKDVVVGQDPPAETTVAVGTTLTIDVGSVGG